MKSSPVRRQVQLASVACLVALPLAMACGASDGTPGFGTVGGPGVAGGLQTNGGTTSTTKGGAVSTNGGTSSGGASASIGGNNPAAGGNPTMGGATVTAGGANAIGGAAAGGSKSTGGVPTNGGSVTTTGGNKATGGAPTTGGAKATGGSLTAGGAKATGGASATGGAKATGGAPAAGGTIATGGKATGGAPATGGAATGTCAAPTWPTPVGTAKTFSSTQTVTKAAGYDGLMALHNGSGTDLGMDCSSSAEQTSVDPIFELEDGATIKNVIFGNFAADGIHCLGSCTIENVWWTDLCDDGATFLGTSASTQVVVNGGGARAGADKTLQHNGAGTITINNFYVQNVGKMYRSCGTCSPQYARHVILNNPTADTISSDLIGINSNHGDSAVFTGTICIRGVSNICTRYNDTTRVSSGPDATYCQYATSQVKTF